MTLKLTNFDSGELEISQQGGGSLRLTQEQAHRLIMIARMRTVDAFVNKLPYFITDDPLKQELLDLFSRVEGSNRWNLKERFARLRTVTKEYQPKDSEKIFETVTLTS